MNLYNFFIVILVFEFFVLFSCLFFLIFERIYILFRERATKKDKQRLSAFFLGLLQEKNLKRLENIFLSSKHFSSLLILSTIEDFDHRFKGEEWQQIKTSVMDRYLIPKARKYRKSFFWKKRLFSARCFSLCPKSEDAASIAILMEDTVFLIWAKACLAALKLEDFALTKQLVQKASRAVGYSFYFLCDALRGGGYNIFQFLEKIVRETESIDIHRVCLDALGHKSFPVDLPILQKYLSSPEENIRLMAVVFFAQSLQKESFSVLKKAVLDASAPIRKEAVLGLARFSTEESMSIIEKALQDAEWVVRVAAAESLKRMGSKAQSIIKAQTERNNPKGYEAIQYIETFG